VTEAKHSCIDCVADRASSVAIAAAEADAQAFIASIFEQAAGATAAEHQEQQQHLVPALQGQLRKNSTLVAARTLAKANSSSCNSSSCDSGGLKGSRSDLSTRLDHQHENGLRVEDGDVQQQQQQQQQQEEEGQQQQEMHGNAVTKDGGWKGLGGEGNAQQVDDLSGQQKLCSRPSTACSGVKVRTTGQSIDPINQSDQSINQSIKTLNRHVSRAAHTDPIPVLLP
jgi:hypothetical protein